LSAIVLLAVFLVVTLKDISNLKRIRYFEQLIRINEEELGALSGDYTPFKDGEEFKDDSHPYAHDLDIFGPYSLFRMINRTTTFRSARKLANWLKFPAEKEEILRRQSSVKTLAPELEWRQEMQAIGSHKNIHQSDFDSISEWAQSRPGAENIRKWNIYTTFALVMTAGFILLAAWQVFSWQILWISLIVHVWITWRAGKVI